MIRDVPEAGLRFDGRIKEDFKLNSGTKVSAGKLRLDALDAMRPLATDVVVVGADRNDVRILVFPDWELCAATAGLDRAAPPAQIASNQGIKSGVAGPIGTSSLRAEPGVPIGLSRPCSSKSPPSHAAGELTEKGTVNSRALQRNRPELLNILFDEAG